METGRGRKPEDEISEVEDSRARPQPKTLVRRAAICKSMQNSLGKFCLTTTNILLLSLLCSLS